MTSSEAPGNRFPGDWGGVVILGNAPVNQVDPLIEGGIIEGTYGGADPDDNSGVFKYVRIEYPGYRFAAEQRDQRPDPGRRRPRHRDPPHPGQLLRSTTATSASAAPSTCTTWWPSAAPTTSSTPTSATSGNLQFAFGLRDPRHWDPTGESNGFESDNDGSGSGA